MYRSSLIYNAEMYISTIAPDAEVQLEITSLIETVFTSSALNNTL